MRLAFTPHDLQSILQVLRRYELSGIDAQSSQVPHHDETDAINAIASLDDEQSGHLIALAFIGCGAYDPLQWNSALSAAQEDIIEVGSAPKVILNMPMSASCIESGLAAMGLIETTQP